MLKQGLRVVVVWISGMIFVVSSVAAQSVDRFKITVPFPFVLDSQTLPAGTYAIERTDSMKPNILTLRKVNGGIVRVVVTQRVEKENPSAEPSLIFIRREGKHYLFQVWNVGAMNGSQIPSADVRELTDRQRTGFTLVTLRSKVR